MNEDTNPFEELPEGLVEEMLSNSKSVSLKLLDKFKEIAENKEKIRQKLKSEGYLRNYSELEDAKIYPTSAGVDGSYTIERMLSMDFACAAAVAVEGITPPGPEKRYWPKPRYFSHIEAVKHNDDTSQILRGISAGLEIHLAVKAPHDVVFIDGSLKTPLIFLNNAVEKIKTVPDSLRDVFLNGKDAVNEDRIKFPGFSEVIEDFKEILKSEKTDKIYAAVPKYTTKNELAEKLGLKDYEDRGFLNFVLEGNEYIGPIDVSADLIADRFHINFENVNDFYSEAVKRRLQENVRSITKDLLPNIFVFYFRPSNYLPVFRIEVPKSIAENKNRLQILFQAIKIQTTYSIMEPYPLYLADRMVKHLSKAIPAIKKSAFQEVSEKWNGDISEIYMGMHTYRTEGGKL